MSLDIKEMDEQALKAYLQDLWQTQLKLEQVEEEDDFLKLGAQSVDMFRMLTKVETDFDLELEFDPFFEDTRLVTLLKVLMSAQS